MRLRKVNDCDLSLVADIWHVKLLVVVVVVVMKPFFIKREMKHSDHVPEIHTLALLKLQCVMGTGICASEHIISVYCSVVCSSVFCRLTNSKLYCCCRMERLQKNASPYMMIRCQRNVVCYEHPFLNANVQ